MACQLTEAAKRLKQGSGNFARSSSRRELYRVAGGTKAAGGGTIRAEASANRPDVYTGLVAAASEPHRNLFAEIWIRPSKGDSGRRLKASGGPRGGLRCLARQSVLRKFGSTITKAAEGARASVGQLERCRVFGKNRNASWAARPKARFRVSCDRRRRRPHL